ncbi:DUF6172 family protein [Sulfurospirillum deleyianum]|uniref:Uncharacterized protein n=1 Tax=Sulfurospirillum deleyianum (strain ATCC 51133 / DSM 6946 / 5175) TaxID=525898 RepID=D1B1H1_SULD5|nr:DUF6172 family protein [Sulfurospirillum deleyianum]ACZ11941.1 conserved hypothetical protein [Sulfurospirillum deleyianum DSM 6946]
MKKIFPLEQENKNSDRVIDALKHEIRKYLKRERNKKLPEGSPFWIFECRFGQSAEETSLVYVQDLIAALDNAYAQKWQECYIEIIAQPAKNLKPTKEAN